MIDFRQNIFIPFLTSVWSRIVRYQVGNVDEEVMEQAPNYVETRLVIVAHDEMTCQSHDARKRYWAFENQHELRKKGVGRGIHTSDVICSTVGHLKAASQQLEYGKNYDGYWTGELFVNQASEKAIKIRHI